MNGKKYSDSLYIFERTERKKQMTRYGVKKKIKHDAKVFVLSN